jgi:formate hydrogenlyase subunit 3/multisubunit Na+/H+ antiporter MnhD subunit
LATDLVGFFSFSTLMGYGFYGLLIHGGDEEVRRAGRLYLFFLIAADLALFEVMLLAANTTEDLQYQAVRQAIVRTSSAQFYLGLVIFGFAAKAGIWPFHLWLMASFNLGHRLTTLLLAGVPIAMGLLGAVRWFPLGEHAFTFFGMILQMLGVAALLYSGFKLFTLNSVNSVRIWPAWSTVAVAGLFVAALGRGLAQPALWHEYEYLAYPFIALLGIFLAALTFAIGRRQDTYPPPTFALQRVEALILLVEGWIDVIQRGIKNKSLGLQSFWCASELKAAELLQQILDWKKPAVLGGGWSATIALFVLLGLVIAWLSH